MREGANAAKVIYESELVPVVYVVAEDGRENTT
jgi:hypothetical protein